MARLKAYEGEAITVLFDARRCIHAGECVRGLPAAFNPKERPWVQPDQADADAIAAVVARCPTGALSFVRTDAGAAEAVPAQTTIEVVPDGPLYVRGPIAYAHNGAPYGQPRAALCRCGLSRNKPFCDNQHTKQSWTDGDVLVKKEMAEPLGSGGCSVQVFPDGPMQLDGPFQVVDGAGEVLFRGEQQWLCRCGESKNKPFCDGSHKAAGFRG